jgi:hypothetical protein
MTGILGGLIGSYAAAAAASSFESIATINGNGSSDTITFSSIPSTYTHLQIRFMIFDGNSGSQGLKLNLNNNTTAGNYRSHFLFGSGSTVTASTTTNGSGLPILIDGLSQQATNVYANVGIIDIQNYASTTQNKTLRLFEGTNNNTATGEIGLNSALWLSTAAINSVTLTYNSSGSSYFTTTSSFALYGIKGA